MSGQLLWLLQVTCPHERDTCDLYHSRQPFTETVGLGRSVKTCSLDILAWPPSLMSRFPHSLIVTSKQIVMVGSASGQPVPGNRSG